MDNPNQPIGASYNEKLRLTPEEITKMLDEVESWEGQLHDEMHLDAWGPNIVLDRCEDIKKLVLALHLAQAEGSDWHNECLSWRKAVARNADKETQYKIGCEVMFGKTENFYSEQFKKVVLGGGKSAYDSLDGINPIPEGWYVIRWPDYEETIDYVYLEDGYKAYIICEIHGRSGRIYIFNLEVVPCPQEIVVQERMEKYRSK